MLVAGYDIGGTKCAALLARTDGSEIEFLAREQFETGNDFRVVLDKFAEITSSQLEAFGSGEKIARGGISCGGPLDGRAGLVLSPPNLPGWDRVPVSKILGEKLGFPLRLRNDADACALAEQRFGAGKGLDNVIFLTFGTGLGAGLVLGGRLYEGACNMAGEAGHIRICEEGPVGYGKRGSFEGFCSGNGIRQQINTYFSEQVQQGITPKYWTGTDSVSAKQLAEQAASEDADALEIFARVGRNFGKGLAVLIDLLNPDMIIAGGVYMRSHRYFDAEMNRVLKSECLPASLSKVRIVPSKLGERIGDYGAIVAAFE